MPKECVKQSLMIHCSDNLQANTRLLKKKKEKKREKRQEVGIKKGKMSISERNQVSEDPGPAKLSNKKNEVKTMKK